MPQTTSSPNIVIHSVDTTKILEGLTVLLSCPVNTIVMRDAYQLRVEAIRAFMRLTEPQPITISHCLFQGESQSSGGDDAK
jgi:hypothetical protein